MNTLCCTFKDTDNIENIWLFKVETAASGNAGGMHPHGHHSCSADGKLVLLMHSNPSLQSGIKQTPPHVAFPGVSILFLFFFSGGCKG